MARPRTIDLTGKTFNNLTVIQHDAERISKSQHRRSFWLCKCKCGKITSVRGECLRGGGTKSCGCIAKQRIPGPQNSNFKGYEELPLSAWSSIKTRAKKIAVPIDISIEHIWKLFLKQNKKCALSGMSLHFGSCQYGQGKITSTASLDRIDSSKGYVIGNIQWIHKDINMMKWTYSQKHFLDICKQIVDNMKLNEQSSRENKTVEREPQMPLVSCSDSIN